MKPPASGWGAGGFFFVSVAVKFKNMSYSNEWLRFRKSEDEYFSSRHAFMQEEEKMVSDLNIALEGVRELNRS